MGWIPGGSEKMRIAFYYFHGGGGGFANIKLLLSAFARSFPEDELFLISGEDIDFGTVLSYANVRRISMRTKPFREWQRFWLGERKLRRIARSIHADVLWSMNLGCYRRGFPPQVLSVHNSHQVACWENRKFHPSNSVSVAFLRWFFRRSLLCSDGVLTQTERMRELVEKVPGCPQLKKVVPKAVEQAEDLRWEALSCDMERKLAGDGTNFLYVATDPGHKNHKVIIQAFRALSETGLRARLLLTLTHSQVAALGGCEAEQLIKDDIIVPLGWVPKEKLKGVYERCDACLIPSRLESLSSAHLEAMQWGKPMVSADLPYAHDLCGEASLYAAVDRPREWEARIRELINDATLREELVRAGYARMQRFPSSWGEVAQKIREFLQKVAFQTGHLSGSQARVEPS